jgi:hypothetical protein
MHKIGNWYKIKSIKGKHMRHRAFFFFSALFLCVWFSITGCVDNSGSGGNGSGFLTEGLVAYYPFNANANDESGNGNNGTVSGATLTTGRKGDANGAYSFDGSNDFISVADDPTLDLSSALSISVWIYPEGGLVDGDSIVEKRETDGWGRYAVWTRVTVAPGVQFGGNDGIGPQTDPRVISSATIGLDDWYHIVGTFDGSKLRIYVDGVPAGEADQTESFTQSDQPLYIGADPLPPDNKFFQGRIDDLRLYNRALDQSEIDLLFNE